MAECSADLQPPTVLVVQDAQDCRWLWRMLLDGDPRFGTVSEVGSTREALELMRRNYFDIVVTEVRTPGGRDLALLELLASWYPRPIVVATSGSQELEPLALEHGATAFWTKGESIAPEMSHRLWTLWRQRAARRRR